MTANLRKKRQIEATVHGYCHAATASGSITPTPFLISLVDI